MKSLAAWYRRNGEAREVLELGEIDPLSPAILRAAAALIGA